MCMLGKFLHAILPSAYLFSKSFFFEKKSFRNAITMLNSLDPDLVRPEVWCSCGFKLFAKAICRQTTLPIIIQPIEIAWRTTIEIISQSITMKVWDSSHTVWIQIRIDILLVMIWGQVFAKIISRWQVTSSMKNMLTRQSRRIYIPDEGLFERNM